MQHIDAERERYGERDREREAIHIHRSGYVRMYCHRVKCAHERFNKADMIAAMQSKQIYLENALTTTICSD